MAGRRLEFAAVANSSFSFWSVFSCFLVAVFTTLRLFGINTTVAPFLIVCQESARHMVKINNTLYSLRLCTSLRSLYVAETKTPFEHGKDYCHLHGDCLHHLSVLLPSLTSPLSLCVWGESVAFLPQRSHIHLPSLPQILNPEIAKEVINKIDCSFSIDRARMCVRNL